MSVNLSRFAYRQAIVSKKFFKFVNSPYLVARKSIPYRGMPKKIVALSIFLAIFLTVSAQNGATSRIEVLKGEKWWGAFVGGAPLEPFDEPFRIHTAESAEGGFFVPVLVSSAGRYIWSDSPMEIDFDGSQFLITSETEKVEVKKAGRTLREAYLLPSSFSSFGGATSARRALYPPDL